MQDMRGATADRAMVDEYKSFVIETLDWNETTTTVDTVRIDTFALLKLLYAARQETRGAELFRASHIMFKKGFLKYLDFAIRHKLISKRKDGKWKSFYSITAKGQKILSAYT